MVRSRSRSKSKDKKIKREANQVRSVSGSSTHTEHHYETPKLVGKKYSKEVEKKSTDIEDGYEPVGNTSVETWTGKEKEYEDLETEEGLTLEEKVISESKNTTEHIVTIKEKMTGKVIYKEKIALTSDSKNEGNVAKQTDKRKVKEQQAKLSKEEKQKREKHIQEEKELKLKYEQELKEKRKQEKQQKKEEKDLKERKLLEDRKLKERKMMEEKAEKDRLAKQEKEEREKIAKEERKQKLKEEKQEKDAKLKALKEKSISKKKKNSN